MTLNTKDIVILGAGCAGLALAVGLANRGVARARKIRVLEPRTDYQRDRTWCYWRTRPHAFEACVEKRWHQMQVRDQGKTALIASSAYTYDYLPADRYYNFALEQLRQHPNIEIHLGAHAREVRQAAGAVHIDTSLGRLDADLVFDSRPLLDERRDADNPLMFQHFLGQHVRVDQAVFDPHRVMLMDFDVEQSGHVHFMYVLTLSATEALIESTWLSAQTLEATDYQKAIADYVQDRFNISNFEVLFEERGAIPLRAPAGRVGQAGIIDIGTRGGCVRPSTGYAFLTIQRQAEHYAELVAHGQHPAGFKARTTWLELMDAALMRLLVHKPQELPALFLQLFERVPTDALIRFLSDEPSSLDTLAVMNASPRLKMATMLLKSIRAS